MCVIHLTARALCIPVGLHIRRAPTVWGQQVEREKSGSDLSEQTQHITTFQLLKIRMIYLPKTAKVKDTETAADHKKAGPFSEHVKHLER